MQQHSAAVMKQRSLSHCYACYAESVCICIIDRPENTQIIITHTKPAQHAPVSKQQQQQQQQKYTSQKRQEFKEKYINHDKCHISNQMRYLGDDFIDIRRHVHEITRLHTHEIHTQTNKLTPT